ncbi:MAG TPA: glutamine--fructose-6-phosphate transaminase (isomerizing) [Thermomicrobiales bacterium]|nr:glutamine--fructose-6-phosphate transaminase (isomerizing) [Thermomicrobiales bacterium]
MCGIFGYVGQPVKVGPVVLEALRSMEYRGYDSWGVAYTTGEQPGGIIKAVGRVEVGAAAGAEATAAIGHTRWATHGEVCERNAHPHLSCGGRIAVVHNGIIENADELRAGLEDVLLASDTDSEIMAHLVAHNVGRSHSLTEAVQTAFSSIEGNNAFVVLDRATGEVVVVTRRLPIRLSRHDDGVVLASDPAALAGMVETAIALPDDTAVSLGTPTHVAEAVVRLIAEGRGVPVPDRGERIEGGPGISMRSEIAEQPAVLRRVAADIEPVLAAVALARQAERVVFTGCGSASHAAMYAADLLVEAEVGIDGVAIPASEILGQPGRIRPGDVMVALTQSGETADVIDAVTIARERGAAVVGLINAEGSSVERLVDVAVPLLAGHERSVLATKSYLAMLARGAQLVRGMTGAADGALGIWLLGEADDVQEVLGSRRTQHWIAGLAEQLAHGSSALMLTSGGHMPVAREAALKVKEGSYVHAEAVLSGELKHGVIALVEDHFPCVMLTPDEAIASRLRIAAEELRSRGAAVYWLGPGAPHGLIQEQAGIVVETPSPFAQTVLMQMVALETALMRGVDPDFPRNLAKSVTVR